MPTVCCAPIFVSFKCASGAVEQTDLNAQARRAARLTRDVD
jgi:hypothetical protein